MFEKLEYLRQLLFKSKARPSVSTEPKIPYKELRKILKTELITLTEEYRKIKPTTIQNSWDYLNLRVKHLAYSRFKGYKFDEIENKWRDPNSWVNTYVKASAEELYKDYSDRVLKTK